jgi:hypothetical protein
VVKNKKAVMISELNPIKIHQYSTRLTPIIPTTQKAESRRIVVQGSPGKSLVRHHVNK